jgi:cysteinyl-tRNA synthetase
MAALQDDLNTPRAISELASLAQARNFSVLKASAAMLGLLQQNPDDWFQGDNSDDAHIQLQIDQRNAAKAARDFVTADRIRDALKAEGIILEDSKHGTTWKRA